MLTPQQIQDFRKKYSIGVANAPTPATGATPKKPQNVFQQFFGGFARGAKESYLEGSRKTVSDIQIQAEKANREPTLPGQLKQFGRAGLRTVGNVIETAFEAPFRGITEGLSDIESMQRFASKPEVSATLDKINEGLSNILTPIAEKWQAFAEKNPERAGDIADSANILLTLMGEKPAQKALEQSFKLAGQAPKAVIGVTGKAIETAGTGLKGAGKAAYGLTVVPEESTRLIMQAYEAQRPTLFGRIKNLLTRAETETGLPPITPAETAARYGLTGTEWGLGVKAKRAANDLWTGIVAPKLQAVKGEVGMKNFLSLVRKEVLKETTGIKKNQMLEAFDAFVEPYNKVGKIGLTKLQEYKEAWAEFLPESVYKGKPIGGALKRVQDIATRKAREVIYKYVGKDGKQAYIDYGNLKSIEKAGIKSMHDPATRGITRNIWEFIMNKAITPVATIGGKILYRTGEGLEFIGRRGAKKVGDIIDQQQNK